MKLRKWNVEEKLAIVMVGLKGKRSVSEIYREHQISQTLYYRWRDRFLEGGKKALVNGAMGLLVIMAIERRSRGFRGLLGSRRFR